MIASKRSEASPSSARCGPTLNRADAPKPPLRLSNVPPGVPLLPEAYHCQVLTSHMRDDSLFEGVCVLLLALPLGWLADIVGGFSPGPCMNNLEV